MRHPARYAFARFKAYVSQILCPRNLGGSQYEFLAGRFQQIDQARIAARGLSRQAHNLAKHFVQRECGRNDTAHAMQQRVVRVVAEFVRHGGNFEPTRQPAHWSNQNFLCSGLAVSGVISGVQGALAKNSFGKRTWDLTKQAFGQWSDDNVPKLAAALSYYTVLSAAPLLVLSVAVAVAIVGQKAADGQLAWELRHVVGLQAALAIQTALQGAHKALSGWIATALGVVSLIIGASSVILELHDSLNLIWGVPPPPDSSWRKMLVRLLKERFFSALVVMGAGCVLFLSLLLSTFVEGLGRFLGPILPAPEWVLHWATFGISFLVVAVLFGAVYKLIPDVRLTWKDVAFGSAVTALLFTIGKQLLAVYLARVGFQSTYGAAWVGVLLLVWVYYSAQMFFLGAEFTKVYARRYGSHAPRPQQAPERQFS